MHTLASLQSFTSAYVQSDVSGKAIIWSLILLSVLCWIVLSYKIWEAQKVKNSSKEFQLLIQKNKEHLLGLDLTPYLRTKPDHIPHPFAQIFIDLKNKTVEILNKKLFFLEKTNEKRDVYLTTSDIEMLDQYISSTINSQHKILEKNLFLLSTIVTLAPFLGLLGTVWGILVTFASMNSGSASLSNATVLEGLSTALSTTVLGLVIAIPALVANNYLRNNLKQCAADMENFSCQLISTLELQYKKVDLS